MEVVLRVIPRRGDLWRYASAAGNAVVLILGAVLLAGPYEIVHPFQSICQWAGTATILQCLGILLSLPNHYPGLAAYVRYTLPYLAETLAGLVLVAFVIAKVRVRSLRNRRDYWIFGTQKARLP